MDGTNYEVLTPEPKDIEKYGAIADRLSELSGKEYGNYAKHKLVIGLN